MKLLGIDPGQTTGICELDVYYGSVTHKRQLQLEWNEYCDYMELGDWDATVVVCEKFLITPQTGKNSQAPWSLEAIGVARCFTRNMSNSFFMYKPSEAKSLITDSVIKSAGVYCPGMPHAMDAARQCLYHLIVKHKLLTECLKG